MCCPALDKTWISCEPEEHQQKEETQDTYLSKRHGPQQTILLTDHIIGCYVFLCLHSATAPCFLKAKEITAMIWVFIQVFATIIRLQPSSDSLESHEDELQPKPSQHEH